MKVSFTTFACPDWKFDQVVDAARRHGYHGIEFRCDAMHRHGVEVVASAQRRTEYRHQLDSAGIRPCCLATSLQFISEAAVEQTPSRLELAVDLGCGALRVLCGQPARSLRSGELIDRCAAHLHEVAPLAVQANVEFWLETHDALCHATQCAAVIDAVDHPNVAITYDNIHPYRMGESLEATVAALGSHVRHCHFHDAINAADQVMVKQLDQGEMPMDQMFQALIQMGFDGYLSGEWFADQYGADPDEALAAYHHDMTELARRNGVQLG